MSVYKPSRPASRSAGARRAPRRRLSREDRREALLGAALRAFGRGGYHGTHVDDIIREAGVARGTFYLHFPGKHEAFAALVDRMLEVFLATKSAAADQPVRTRRDADAMLRAIYAGVLDTFWRHRHLARLFLEEAVGADKGFSAKLDEHAHRWRERVSGRLETFVKAGVARADLDVEATAEMVLGMVEHVTRRFVLPAARPDLPRWVEALVRFEMAGIGRR